jgi:ABC-type transport system substrate-binding protein
MRRVGFDVREVAVPRAQQRDGQVRSTFPALYLGGGGLGEKDTLPNMVSSNIPSPQNHWAGGNRGGWSDPEFDRLFDAYSTTLARSERDRLIVQMAKRQTEEVGAVSLLFYPSVVAHASALRGPRMYAGTSTVVWNLQEWQWTS